MFSLHCVLVLIKKKTFWITEETYKSRLLTVCVKQKNVGKSAMVIRLVWGRW